MLEDIYRTLDAIKETSQQQERKIPTAFKTHIPEMESALVNALVEDAIDAMDKTPEYSVAEAEPLRNRLIQNLSAIGGDGRPVHVRITEDGNTYIFDEQFAGTAGDFAQAKHNSKNPQPLRYRFWKYGIYARDVTGNYEPSTVPWFEKAVDKLPSYSEIIAERLSVWGNKAPYWYFIEHGVTGGGVGYPSFPGTNFISKFDHKAKEAVRKLQDDILREFTESASEAVSKAATEGIKQIPISDTEILAKAVRKNGNSIWQRREKGRFASGPTFKE